MSLNSSAGNQQREMHEMRPIGEQQFQQQVDPLLAAQQRLGDQFSPVDDNSPDGSYEAFKVLRKKVMYISIGTGIFGIMHVVLEYLFKVEGKLEFIKLIHEAEGNPGPKHHGAMGFIFLAGLPALLFSLCCGMSVPFCGWYGAKSMNSKMLGLFSCCNCLGGCAGIGGILFIMWLMAFGVPMGNTWVRECDAASICCSDATGANLCHPNGLPMSEHEDKFIDCVLAAEPMYSWKYSNDQMPHMSNPMCEPAAKILARCDDFGMDAVTLDSEFEHFRESHPDEADYYFHDMDEDYGSPEMAKRYLRELFAKNREVLGESGDQLLLAAPRQLSRPATASAHSKWDHCLSEPDFYNSYGSTDLEMTAPVEHFQFKRSDNPDALYSTVGNVSGTNDYTLSDDGNKIVHSTGAVHATMKMKRGACVFDWSHGYFSAPASWANHKPVSKDAWRQCVHDDVFYHSFANGDEGRKTVVDECRFHQLGEHAFETDCNQSGKNAYHVGEDGRLLLDAAPDVIFATLERKGRDCVFHWSHGYFTEPIHFHKHEKKKGPLSHLWHKAKDALRGHPIDRLPIPPPSELSRQFHIDDIRNKRLPAEIESKELFNYLSPEQQKALGESFAKLPKDVQEMRKREFNDLPLEQRPEVLLKAANDAMREVQRRRRPHRPHHDDGNRFENCEPNEKVIKVLHVLNENLPDIVPKAEIMLGVKLLVSIPAVLFSILAALWGWRLYQKAKRGYLPPQFAALQQPFMGHQDPMGAAPAMFVVPRGQPQPMYHVNYPGVGVPQYPGMSAFEYVQQGVVGHPEQNTPRTIAIMRRVSAPPQQGGDAVYENVEPANLQQHLSSPTASGANTDTTIA